MKSSLAPTAALTVILLAVAVPGSRGLGRVNESQADATAALTRDAIGTLDAAGVVAAAGKDPARLFAWVRTETRFVPYLGALRGADGVLIDRRGNSLDRSLLLAETLRLSGSEARLAHGTLTPAQAATLLASARSDAQAFRAAEIAATKVVTPASSAAIGDAKAAATMASASQSRTRIQAEFAKVLGESRKAVAAVAARLKARAGDSQREDTRAAQDHWWVQVRNPAGWTDYDLAAPDGRPGKAMTTATEQLAPTALGPSQVHELAIRVVVEQFKSAKFTEAVALEHRFQPRTLSGRTVTLTFLGQDRPKATGGEAEVLQRLPKDAAATTRWIPVLTIGTRPVTQKSFTRTGDVLAISAKPVDLGTGGGFDAFGGGLGGDDVEPGRLAGVWIEFETRSPGEPPQVVRREFLDVAGPSMRSKRTMPAANATLDAQRIGLTLSGDMEILPLVAEPSDRWIAGVITRSLDECTQAFGRVGPAKEIDFEASGRLQAACSGFPGALHRVALLRQMPGDGQPHKYLRRTNVLSLLTRPRLEGTQLIARTVMDLATAPVGVLTESTQSAFDMAVEQGLRDGAAESLAFADVAADVSTGGVFLRAASQARAPRLFEKQDLGSVDALPTSADAKARIAADLNSGYSVLVASAVTGGSTTLGWWRIHPVTGETVGVMDSGFNQNTTDVGLANTLISQTMIWGGRAMGRLAVSGMLGMLGMVLRFVVEKMLPIVQGAFTPGHPIHRFLLIKQVEIHLWLETIGNSPLKVFQR